ncbi:hypothetical protein RDI58_019953 [Solanum bulbocastanum]|uniref:Uncharacterized protein n=1 Tax=Solanum bulbocastanum TaxID=147425 RepID=A0AAN8Y7F5_SOLBU
MTILHSERVGSIPTRPPIRESSYFTPTKVELNHQALRLSGNSSTRHRRKECRIGMLCWKEAIRQI